MRLLLIEDERELSDGLVLIFKRYKYTVDTAYNGEEGLRLAKNNEYEAIVLDIMLPKKNGFDVIKELRDSGNTTPILVLSAKNEIDDKVTGLDLGADDYLAKPFETKELLARIRSLTRRKEKILNNLYLGNTTLNRLNYDVSTDTMSIKLNNKEFQILELLMSHPNRLFSTTEILDKIWSLDSANYYDSVWVYISMIRKTLTKINSNLKIKSKRNSGYYLEIE